MTPPDEPFRSQAEGLRVPPVDRPAGHRIAQHPDAFHVHLDHVSGDEAPQLFMLSVSMAYPRCRTRAR